MSTLSGKTLDQYRLRDMIGQGGMATVYRAVDTSTQAEVAIKVLSPTISSDRRFIRRFRREANLVAQLTHPNIVPVLAYGQAEGFVYAAMPYVRGATLSQKIAKGRLSREECVRWVGQVADALSFAHEKGIIHRDIKPSNVIISQSGDAMLTDFGLARAIEGHSSLTGSMLMGTPAYVSPEQGRGEELDARSDQYSLGVILYEIHTGRLPFEDELPMATVMAHIQEPPPRPRRFNPELPPDVEVVILKSLAKRRESRFEDVRALNQAYQAALAGQALPEFDGVPVGPTVRLPPRQFDAREPRVEPLPRRRVRWIYALLIPVLGVAAFFSYQLIRGNNGAVPAPAEPTTSVNQPPANTQETQDQVTATPQPTMTLAPLPITSDACPGITLFPPQYEGDRVSWLIDNASQSELRFSGLGSIMWPLTPNGPLDSIEWGDIQLGQGPYNPDDQVDIDANLAPSLQSGESTRFSLRFRYEAERTGYSLGLSFSVGCTLTGSW